MSVRPMRPRCEWYSADEASDGFAVIAGPEGFTDDNGETVEPGMYGMLLDNLQSCAVVEGTRDQLRAMLTATLAKLDGQESTSRPVDAWYPSDDDGRALCGPCRDPEHDTCGKQDGCDCCDDTARASGAQP